MPTQTETILAPMGGLKLDLPTNLISVLHLSDCQNVFFEDGLLKKRYGYKKMGINLPLSGAIMGSDQYYKFAPGQSFLLVMTTRDIYRWDTSNKAWVQITSSVDLDDCESGWAAGSGDTVAHDTSDFIRGSKSTKITLVAQRSDGNLLAYKDISSTGINAHNSIGFWIRSSTDLAANALEVVVSEDDHATGEKSGALGTDYIECLTTELVANTWTFVRLAKTLTNFDAVISVSIFANTTLASGLIVYLDDIRAYTPFTGTDEDIFSYDYIRKLTEDEPWWVCTNGVDAIKKWDGSDYSVDDLGGSPPKAKRLVSFKDHLHLMDVTEGNRFPQRDRWSDTGDPENWSTGNASYKDLPGADWISNGMKFKGDYLVVLKERSIEVGWATGDSEIFEFDCKVSGAGCAAPNTIESLGDEIIFLGWDDVYVFNGVDYEPIGTRVQRELFRTLNPEQIGRSFGVIIEEQKEYWLFITSTLSTYPDMAWCFNYNLNVWTKHSFADFITMYGYYFLEAAMTWDDLTGSWQQQTFRWDDRTILSHAPTTLFGDKDGNVYEYTTLTNNDDDTAIDAYFDTKDFVRRDASGRVIRHRVLGIDVYFKGPSLQVYYSTDRGATWNLISTLGVSTTFERTPVYLRIDSEFSRFRFRNAEDNEHFEFERAEVRWQYAGRKL